MRLLVPLVMAALCSAPALALAMPGPTGPAQVGQDAPPPAPSTTPPTPKFPMPADEFRRHMEHRERHFRKLLEEYIAQQQMPAQQADDLRSRFNAGVAQVDARVGEVCSDGTVTQDEAMSVHRLAHQLLRSLA